MKNDLFYTLREREEKQTTYVYLVYSSAIPSVNDSAPYDKHLERVVSSEKKAKDYAEWYKLQRENRDLQVTYERHELN